MITPFQTGICTIKGSDVVLINFPIAKDDLFGSDGNGKYFHFAEEAPFFHVVIRMFLWDNLEYLILSSL